MIRRIYWIFPKQQKHLNQLVSRPDCGEKLEPPYCAVSFQWYAFRMKEDLSRRDFLKNTGKVIAGAALAGAGIEAQSADAQERKFAPSIRSKADLVQETPLSYVRKEARQFLDANKDKIIFNNETGALHVEVSGGGSVDIPADSNVTEVHAVSSDDDSIVAFSYLLGKDGRDGIRAVNIRKRANGELDVDGDIQ